MFAFQSFAMAPKRAPPKATAKAKASSEEENYDTWPVAKLQAKLKELGMSTTGGKDALIERVKAVIEADVKVPAPKREAAAKAKAEPEPAPKAKAKAAAAKAPAAKRETMPSAAEPPAKKAKSEPKASQGQKRDADGQPKHQESDDVNVPAANISGPATVFYDDGKFNAEYAKSSKSTCNKCKEKILQGEMRLGKSVRSDKFDGFYTQWNHAACFWQLGILPRSTDQIVGYSALRPEDQDEISKKVPNDSSGSSQDDGPIKEQNKKLFEIIDALKAMSDPQLKEMLELNGYPSKHFPPGTAGLKELCADGIMFGAVAKCGVCAGGTTEGTLLLKGEGYKCNGYISEFLKCTNKTQAPERTKWKLTQTAKKACSQASIELAKFVPGNRLFASEMKERDEDAPTEKQKKPVFLGVTVSVVCDGDNLKKDKIIELIQQNGGSCADAVTKAAICVVGAAEMVNDENNEVLQIAKKLSLPGVSDEFISGSVEAGELLDMSLHLLWGEARRDRTVGEAQTSKFVEKDGVRMDSDVGEEMLGKAHVLVDRNAKRVYSEMLSKTDITSGSNSFYTLHLLESDGMIDQEYWVFRKWGRIGVNQGGTKLQKWDTKEKAIQDFCKLYEKQTGNVFGHKSSEFVKKPGMMVRVDVEHKALAAKRAKTEGDGQSSNVEGGAGSDDQDQPLGKLSKSQIEKGDAVLDRIQTLLDEGALESDIPAKKAQAQGKFAANSAEFYSLIPHNFGVKKPPIINNTELLGSEKALLQFYLRMGFEEMDTDDSKLTPIGGVMDLPLPKTLEEAAKMVCGNKDIVSCMKKAGPMHKKKAGSPNKPMTPDLYGSILLYTANAIYKQLNKALRDEDRKKVEAFFPYLRLLFEACARLPQQSRTLWRGIGVDLFPTYKVGSTITWWGVSSCTSEQSVARNFMAGCGDGATFLTIEAKTACDISQVSFYANEAESILLPGTQLEVLSSKKTGTKSEISLREVGRCVN